MGLKSAIFGPDLERTELTNEVKELRKVLVEVRAEADLETLKKEISDLEIEKSKREEEFAKERREIDHKIGLERERVEMERKHAVTEAELAVKSENMQGERDRFEQEMKFMRDRMEKEVESMRHLYDKLMERMPTVTVDRQIRENYGKLERGEE